MAVVNLLKSKGRGLSGCQGCGPKWPEWLLEAESQMAVLNASNAQRLCGLSGCQGLANRGSAQMACGRSRQRAAWPEWLLEAAAGC